ncbi:hypothetical protein ENUP19_0352G0001 [Entamoeba nuttalli]|uniref:Uncharacterized protein n=1 Tax=Entamoeba nuttalli TaxID=412467 RepID=A0ABQ0DXW3_9EUKA
MSSQEDKPKQTKSIFTVIWEVLVYVVAGTGAVAATSATDGASRTSDCHRADRHGGANDCSWI